LAAWALVSRVLGDALVQERDVRICEAGVEYRAVRVTHSETAGGAVAVLERRLQVGAFSFRRPTSLASSVDIRSALPVSFQ